MSRIFSLRTLLISFVCIHALLFLYDLSNPDAFLTGDRAHGRLNNVNLFLESLENSSTTTNSLTESGRMLGDYIFHSLFYFFYGSYSVIIIQLVLSFIAIIFLYRLSYLLFNSYIISNIAAFSYILLPGSLHHPHVLASEAIFNPLVIVSFYYSVRYLKNKTGSVNNLIIAALIGSLASFVRAVFIFYPIVFFFIIIFGSHSKRIKHACIYTILSFSLPLLWMTFFFIQTGEFSMGGGGRPSGGLYARVVRMSNLESFEIDDLHREKKRISIVEFVEYVSEHPNSYSRSFKSDVFTIIFNSGINSFAGSYLELYTFCPDNQYWKNIRDQEGLLSMIFAIFKWSPLMITMNLIMSALWLLFLSISVYGAYLFMRDKNLPFTIKSALIGFPPYIIVSPLIVTSAARWSHRTPTEFVLSLMFALAVVQIFEKIKSSS